MPISYSRRALDASSWIFSSIINSSNWTGGIYCVKYRKTEAGRITAITLIPADKLDNEKLREEIRQFLLQGLGNSNPNIDTVKVKRISLDFGNHSETVEHYLPRAVYHAFVILKTEGYYMSLEKHRDSFTFQISEDIDDVLRKVRDNPRCNVPEMIVEDRGHITVTNLKDFIIDSNFVREGYDIFTGNHCKKFAKDIFDKVALSKKYDWEEEENRALEIFEYTTVAAAGIITRDLVLEPVARLDAIPVARLGLESLQNI